jgi:DNA-binding IscR family transcriptional regulator
MVKTCSVSDRRDLSLILALMLTERAEKRGAPLADSEAADHLGMPLKLVDQELKKLVRIGAVVRVDGDEGVEGGNGSTAERYVLAVPPDRLTVGELVVAWEGLRNGGDGQETGEMSDLAERFPELLRIKERLNAACLDGSAQTLREVWSAMRPADSEN